MQILRDAAVVLVLILVALSVRIDRPVAVEEALGGARAAETGLAGSSPVAGPRLLALSPVDELQATPARVKMTCSKAAVGRIELPALLGASGRFEVETDSDGVTRSFVIILGDPEADTDAVSPSPAAPLVLGAKRTSC